MRQTCCICGREDDEYFMDRLLTGGARAKWICNRCRLKGNHELSKSEVAKKRRRLYRKEDNE